MQTENTAIRTFARRFIGFQLMMTLLMALIWLVLHSAVAAYSALIGGLTNVIPNAFFVKFAFSGSGSVTPPNMLIRFYIGEAGKLVLTGILFGLCFFIIKPLHVGALFTSFIVVILINLAGLSVMSRAVDNNLNTNN